MECENCSLARDYCSENLLFNSCKHWHKWINSLYKRLLANSGSYSKCEECQ